MEHDRSLEEATATRAPAQNEVDGNSDLAAMVRRRVGDATNREDFREQLGLGVAAMASLASRRGVFAMPNNVDVIPRLIGYVAGHVLQGRVFQRLDVLNGGGAYDHDLESALPDLDLSQHPTGALDLEDFARQPKQRIIRFDGGRIRFSRELLPDRGRALVAMRHSLLDIVHHDLPSPPEISRSVPSDSLRSCMSDTSEFGDDGDSVQASLSFEGLRAMNRERLMLPREGCTYLYERISGTDGWRRTGHAHRGG